MVTPKQNLAQHRTEDQIAARNVFHKNCRGAHRDIAQASINLAL
jgi:hypothetical protein